MTREKAIAFFKDMNECTYGDVEAVEMAIKALQDKGHDHKKAKRFKNKYLKLKTAIGKIKAEIENADAESFKNPDYHRGLLFALDIIDKHMGDTE